MVRATQLLGRREHDTLMKRGGQSYFILPKPHEIILAAAAAALVIAAVTRLAMFQRAITLRLLAGARGQTPQVGRKKKSWGNWE